MSKLKYNLAAFREIRRSPEVAALVDAEARKTAADAGEGFSTTSRLGRTRHRAYIQPDTAAAWRREARDAVMLKTAAALGMKLGGER